MAHPKFCNFARIKCKTQKQFEKPEQGKRKKSNEIDIVDTIIGILPKVKVSQKFAYTLLWQTLALC